jgi:hypothetical protein
MDHCGMGYACWIGRHNQSTGTLGYGSSVLNEILLIEGVCDHKNL